MMTGKHEPEPEPEEAAQVAAAMSVWLRRGAMAVAVSRVGVGVVAFAAPGLVSRSWTGGAGDGPSGQVPGQLPGQVPGRALGHVLGRALGGRDLALGLGALVALRLQPAQSPASIWGAAMSTDPGKPDPAAAAAGLAAGMWVGLAALADGLDLVTTAVSWRDLPARQRWLVALSSGGAAAVGAAAAVSLAAGPSPLAD
jgi:hypothetical protein